MPTKFLETPTTFYLGCRYDAAARQPTPEPIYYASRDLVTHAVIVGMTGSGKTGLGISLVEEAVMDNVPVLVIDPKGDLTNLLLNFPQLRPEDFAPWINPDDARHAGAEPAAYAQTVANIWRNGLADAGIAPGRIGAMTRAAQFSIYTPGSDAGLPLRILDSLRAPKEGWAGNEEPLRERINSLTTALLALIGKEADPVRDREHVLIANIFEHAWQLGQDLTLELLIQQVQQPPFQALGVFDIEKFFPAKERGKLALALNQIVASPSFQAWLRGDPLDPQTLLYQPDGRPRVSIIYLAHLSDSERLFVVSMLLEAVNSWMRGLTGTSTLRALIYFDELFGFFPPAPHNPPSKEPILRLLKQARAFGVGMVLATQNPIDLDYKGLANAGTWFIGKLQTDNDKARVLTGLQNISTAERPLNMQALDRLLSTLGPRVFVMNNVHDEKTPTLVYTRWTMSYLHGPLTRPQISQLMAGQRHDRALSTLANLPDPAMPQSPSNAPLPFTMPAVNTPVPPLLTPIPSSTSPLFGSSNTPTFSKATVPGVPVFGPAATNASVPPPPPATLPESGLTPTWSQSAPPSTSPEPPATPAPKVSKRAAAPAQPAEPVVPSVPAGIDQYYLPVTFSARDAINAWSQRTKTAIAALGDARLVYHPMLLGQVAVRFLDRKTRVEEHQVLAYRVNTPDPSALIKWSDFRATTIPDTMLSTAVPTGAFELAPVPPGLTDAKRLTSLKADLLDYVYRSASLPLFYHAGLQVVSGAGEDKNAYLARLQAAMPAEQRQNADEWAKVSGAVETLTLTPSKKDIAIAQYGVAWLPAWHTVVNGQPMAFGAFAANG